MQQGVLGTKTAAVFGILRAAGFSSFPGSPPTA